MSKIVSVGEVADQLIEESAEAQRSPRRLFGFASFGAGWPELDKLTGGLQAKKLVVLASRPKVGKSMLAAGWLPALSEQALFEGKVVRVVTLEMTRASYLRRMAAQVAGIKKPNRIRQGELDAQEVRDYNDALRYIATLPIEFLSNEDDLTEEEAMIEGGSAISFRDIANFVRQSDTFWWLVDHIGLVADLDTNYNATDGLRRLSNRFKALAHRTVGGMLITHLTRESVGSGMPGMESIAGSDQLGRNADGIMLLWRPLLEAKNLSDDVIEAMKTREPAILQYFSRDEGSGIDFLVWSAQTASFTELVTPDGKRPELLAKLLDSTKAKKK